MATPDADIYSLFMGGQDAGAQAQAQAEALRRRREAASLGRNAGNVALLTGDRVLGQFGQAQLQQAAQGEGEVGRGEGLLAQAGSQFAGRQLQQALAERQAQAQARQLAEAARHNRASEAMGRPPPFVIVTGEGGQQFFVDPRNPTTPAAPVMGPDGKPLAKPGKGSTGAELAVPGFERLPGAPAIRDVEISDMRSKVAAEERMGQLIDEAAKAKKTGREIVPGFLGNTDIATQKGAGTNLLLGLKGLEATGALDAGTVEVAQPLIPSPTDSAATAAEKLGQLRTLVRSGVESKAKSLGYRRAAPSAGGSFGLEEPPPAQPQADARRDAALKWALEHPDDPRAAAALQRLGVK